MYLNRYMKTVVNPYSGILFSNKKKFTIKPEIDMEIM